MESNEKNVLMETERRECEQDRREGEQERKECEQDVLDSQTEPPSCCSGILDVLYIFDVPPPASMTDTLPLVILTVTEAFF